MPTIILGSYDHWFSQLVRGSFFLYITVFIFEPYIKYICVIFYINGVLFVYARDFCVLFNTLFYFYTRFKPGSRAINTSPNLVSNGVRELTKLEVLYTVSYDRAKLAKLGARCWSGIPPFLANILFLAKLTPVPPILGEFC